MTDAPELLPPDGADDQSIHTLLNKQKRAVCAVWDAAVNAWGIDGDAYRDPTNAARVGYIYYRSGYIPARPDDATERARLSAEVARLRKWVDLMLPIVTGCADDGLVIDGHDAQDAIVAIAADLGFTDDQDWTGTAIQKALRHDR